MATGSSVTGLGEEAARLRQGAAKVRGDEQKSSQARICGTSRKLKVKSSIHHRQCSYTRRLRTERCVFTPGGPLHLGGCRVKLPVWGIPATKPPASSEDRLLTGGEPNSATERDTKLKEPAATDHSSEPTARCAQRAAGVSKGHNVTGGNEMREIPRDNRNRSLTPAKGPNGARTEWYG